MKALVTGGGRGIGANIARALAGDGWDVVVAARSRDQVDAVAAEIGGQAIELDVASAASVDACFSQIGSVDLLVANAGVASADLWRVVQTEMTSFSRDLPWTPPELAPELVRKLATGKYDVLAGRYIHAEHDDVDDMLARSDEILANDLNAIRLRR